MLHGEPGTPSARSPQVFYLWSRAWPLPGSPVGLGIVDASRGSSGARNDDLCGMERKGGWKAHGQRNLRLQTDGSAGDAGGPRDDLRHADHAVVWRFAYGGLFVGDPGAVWLGVG